MKVVREISGEHHRTRAGQGYCCPTHSNGHLVSRGVAKELLLIYLYLPGPWPILHPQRGGLLSLPSSVDSYPTFCTHEYRAIHLRCARSTTIPNPPSICSSKYSYICQTLSDFYVKKIMITCNGFSNGGLGSDGISREKWELGAVASPLP